MRIHKVEDTLYHNVSHSNVVARVAMHWYYYDMYIAYNSRSMQVGALFQCYAE